MSYMKKSLHDSTWSNDAHSEQEHPFSAHKLTQAASNRSTDFQKELSFSTSKAKSRGFLPLQGQKRLISLHHSRHRPEYGCSG